MNKYLDYHYYAETSHSCIIYSIYFLKSLKIKIKFLQQGIYLTA